MTQALEPWPNKQKHVGGQDMTSQFFGHQKSLTAWELEERKRKCVFLFLRDNLLLGCFEGKQREIIHFGVPQF